MIIATPAKTAERDSRETPVVTMATTAKAAKSGPDGLDINLSGRNACGDGSDADDGEAGRMGQEADTEAISEVEGVIDVTGRAAPAAAVGLLGNSKPRRRPGKRRSR